MKIPVKLKRDRFSARRGGVSKALDIHCGGCGNVVLIYQKDGAGPLLMCYADRIIYPEVYKKLKNSKSVKDMPKLICNDCDAVMGLPTRYREHGENRLAFKMISSAFRKRTSVQVKIK
jgi:hypothetical protein